MAGWPPPRPDRGTAAGRMLRVAMRSRSPLGVSSTNVSQGPTSSWGGGAVRMKPRRRGPACRRQIPGDAFDRAPSRIAGAECPVRRRVQQDPAYVREAPGYGPWSFRGEPQAVRDGPLATAAHPATAPNQPRGRDAVRPTARTPRPDRQDRSRRSLRAQPRHFRRSEVSRADGCTPCRCLDRSQSASSTCQSLAGTSMVSPVARDKRTAPGVRQLASKSMLRSVV